VRKEKKDRKTRLPRFARNDGIMMCHSECSEESTPSISQLADPSQNRLRMTKDEKNSDEHQIAALRSQ
jgi:hypothetical protein